MQELSAVVKNIFINYSQKTAFANRYGGLRGVFNIIVNTDNFSICMSLWKIKWQIQFDLLIFLCGFVLSFVVSFDKLTMLSHIAHWCYVMWHTVRVCDLYIFYVLSMTEFVNSFISQGATIFDEFFNVTLCERVWCCDYKLSFRKTCK